MTRWLSEVRARVRGGLGVEAWAVDVGNGRSVHAGLAPPHQTSASCQLVIRRVIRRPHSPGSPFGQPVTLRPVAEPAPCCGAVVAGEECSLGRHLVRWRDVEVGGEPAPSVVAHRVSRDRKDLCAVGIDDGQSQAAHRQQAAQQGEARQAIARLDPGNGRRGDGQSGGEVALAEICTTAHPHNKPTHQRRIIAPKPATGVVSGVVRAVVSAVVHAETVAGPTDTGLARYVTAHSC